MPSFVGRLVRRSSRVTRFVSFFRRPHAKRAVRKGAMMEAVGKLHDLYEGRFRATYRRKTCVKQGSRSWVLYEGLGIAFYTCWHGERTMIHAARGDCPHDSQPHPFRLVSCHSAHLLGDTRNRIILQLPSVPTLKLFDHNEESPIEAGDLLEVVRGHRCERSRVEVKLRKFMGHRRPINSPEALSRLADEVAYIFDYDGSYVA